MKRSKAFLGLTTCILAIASIAAAKARHNVTAKVYTQPNNAGACVQFAATQVTTTSGTPTAVTANGNIIWTLNSACIHKMFQGN